MPQTVRRAVQVLYFVCESPMGRSLMEIASALNLNKATTYRLAQVLTETGLFRQDPKQRRYFPGEGLRRLAGLLEHKIELRNIALSHMQRLRDVTKETIALVIAKGNERVTIEVLPSVHELKLVPPLYAAKPIYAGAPGKALLAHLPEQDVEQIIGDTQLHKLAAGTIVSPDKLRADLKRIRELGYASSVEETIPGGAAVAAPIFGFRGDVVAALNVYGPRIRLDNLRLRKYGRLAVDVANCISNELGASVEAPQRSRQ
jgi:DNA-binding IclR family transcriptional regulator